MDVTDGFEIGPIRPPSEAYSLLVRVTRNCPWNRCAFCPVYKGSKFSIRKVDEVKADIDAMARVAESLREFSQEQGHGGQVTGPVLRAAARGGAMPPGAGQVATFLAFGGEHVFLQDANSLVMRPEQLVEVLEHLRAAFPTITRITSYARAHTLTRRKPEQLRALFEAGLNRVHVGLESGSDQVLELIKKGADAERHIEGGLRAKAAGMELSEYLMPGLGGERLSRDHALQSARVLSAIDPHFIRLRSTAVVPGSDLAELMESGQWAPLQDERVPAELRLFLEHLECTSMLQSDHALNLLTELEGQLPDDKPHMLALLDRFDAMEPQLRRAFVLGRRAGVLSLLSDMEHDTPGRSRALALLDRVEQQYGGDLQAAIRDLMMRFI